MYGRKPIGSVAYMGGLQAILEPFCWSFAQMVAFNEEFLADDFGYVHILKATFSDHAPARNDLVSRFAGDWLLQLDTDHSFDADLTARLLWLADTAQVDILSGVYHMKGPPHVPVLFRWEEMDPQPMPKPIVTWPKEASIIEIGSAGGGCLFVRRKVFDAVADHFKCGAFDKIHPYSEDHSFFYRCRELGIKAYAAVNVEAQHLKVSPITYDDLDLGYMEIEKSAAGGFG